MYPVIYEDYVSRLFASCKFLIRTRRVTEASTYLESFMSPAYLIGGILGLYLIPSIPKNWTGHIRIAVWLIGNIIGPAVMIPVIQLSEASVVSLYGYGWVIIAMEVLAFVSFIMFLWPTFKLVPEVLKRPIVILQVGLTVGLFFGFLTSSGDQTRTLQSTKNFTYLN